MIKKRDRLSIKRKGFARALGVVDPSKIREDQRGLSGLRKIFKEKWGKLTGAMWSLS